MQGVQNALLRVFLNGKAVKTQSGTNAEGETVGNTKNECWSMTGDQIGENSRIKIVLSPNGGVIGDGTASAKLLVQAHFVPKWVDSCMDRLYCLKKLGDGSAEAFELRNSNRRQYECLLGNPKASLTSICGAWNGCFDGQSGTSHKTELLQLLKAVFEKAEKAPTDLVETKPVEAIQDEEGCVDPETADAESAECECFESAKAQCDANGVTDSEECFKSHLCGHDSVCQSWKTEAGCSSVLLMRRGIRRSSVATTANHTRSRMATTAHATLDGSVRGKCTSETQ